MIDKFFSDIWMLMTKAPIFFWGSMLIIVLVVWGIQHWRYAPLINARNKQIEVLGFLCPEDLNAESPTILFDQVSKCQRVPLEGKE